MPNKGSDITPLDDISLAGDNGSRDHSFAGPMMGLLAGLDRAIQFASETAKIIDAAADQAAAQSNSRLIEELGQLNWSAITALARMVDSKSAWTSGHSERVTKMALKIGKILGLSDKELDTLHIAGLLHDIGELSTPVDLLNKPGKLSDDEFRTIKKHPLRGAQMLEPIKAYAEAIPLIAQHHERVDGKGYPEGLAGEEISMGGRILAVVEVFDALMSDRPYRPGMPLEEVVDFIRYEVGTHFEPSVVKAVLKVIEQEAAP